MYCSLQLTPLPPPVGLGQVKTLHASGVPFDSLEHWRVIVEIPGVKGQTCVERKQTNKTNPKQCEMLLTESKKAGKICSTLKQHSRRQTTDTIRWLPMRQCRINRWTCMQSKLVLHIIHCMPQWETVTPKHSRHQKYTQIKTSSWCPKTHLISNAHAALKFHFWMNLFLI